MISSLDQQCDVRVKERARTNTSQWFKQSKVSRIPHRDQEGCSSIDSRLGTWDVDGEQGGMGELVREDESREEDGRDAEYVNANVHLESL
jgi:hypothetical protein